MMKTISHSLAIIIMVLIAVSTLLVIYAWVSGYLQSEESSASSSIEALKKMAKIEAYRIYDAGTRYILTLAIRNICDKEITINGVIIKNAAGLAYTFTPLSSVNIPPGHVSIVTFPIPKDKLQVSSSETLYVSALLGQAGSSAIVLKGELFQKAPRLVVYLINITNIPGSWGNPILISRALEGKAIIKIIDNLNDLDTLIRNPPNDAIIINCHDEVTPIPPSWNNDWTSYFRTIGKNIRDHGWIWVSIMGYPFYYINDGTTKIAIGENGIGAVLSVYGGSATFWSDSYNVVTANATDTAIDAEKATGINLPSQLVDAPRQSIFVSGIIPSFIFYENITGDKVFYASASYRLGRGYIIINGLGGGEPAEVIANISAATALYTKITSSLIPVSSSSINSVYVLAIPNVGGSWVSADGDLSTSPGTSQEYYESALQLSKRVGIKNTYLIDTLDELKNLILNPPNKIVILNMHGEVLPTPNDWWSSSSSNPTDYVSSYVFDNVYVADLHAVAPASGAASFTLYNDTVATLISTAEAIRISIKVAPISPCHSFGVGFTSLPDISDTSGRVFEVEVRLRDNSILNPIDIVIWHNNTVVEQGVLSGTLNPHSWYNLTLTIYNNDIVELEVYDENGNLLYSYSSPANPGFNDVRYVTIGLWGVDSRVHDASYLVGKVILSYKENGAWTNLFNIDGSQILNYFDFYLNTAQGSGSRYKGWMGLIAWNIWRHGWAWCNIKGYPLHYIKSDTNSEIIGSNGWSYMKFLLGINPSLLNIVFTGVDAYPTQLGKELTESLYPPKWIPRIYAPRPVSDFEGLPNVHIYYINQAYNYAPVFAVKAGNGVFIDSGLGGNYAIDHGSTALSLAIAVKELG